MVWSERALRSYYLHVSEVSFCRTRLTHANGVLHSDSLYLLSGKKDPIRIYVHQRVLMMWLVYRSSKRLALLFDAPGITSA